jgi:GT2 family glycosyltransferase
MPSTPLVSIVMPVYLGSADQVRLLDETLGTVAEQTCRDYEVVLVDDGSPRDVAAVAGRHARTTTLRQPNGGSAVARNTGIAASRGQYFVFLDADDHLLPPALEAGLACLGEHPECGFVVGRREEMTYEGGPVPWGVASVPTPAQLPDLYNILLGFDWYIIPPSSAMFRREAVEAVGGFRDPWGADDLDFYLRVARAFRGWCFDAPAVTRYRRYAASSSRDGERMLNSIRAVYARQWPVVQGDPRARPRSVAGSALLEGIFTDCLVENVRDRVRAREWRRALRSARMLARERPRALIAAVGRGCAPSPAVRRSPPAEARRGLAAHAAKSGRRVLAGVADDRQRSAASVVDRQFSAAPCLRVSRRAAGHRRAPTRSYSDDATASGARTSRAQPRGSRLGLRVAHRRTASSPPGGERRMPSSSPPDVRVCVRRDVRQAPRWERQRASVADETARGYVTFMGASSRCACSSR